MRLDLSVISGSDETLWPFMQAVDDMATGKFILAERNLRNVLKKIAVSARLLSVFSYAASACDFNRAFDSYVNASGPHKRIEIPNEPRAFSGFVYRLFREIDDREIDMYKLLSEYYEGEYSGAYEFFVETVVLPLKDATRALFFNPDVPDIAIHKTVRV